MYRRKRFSYPVVQDTKKFRRCGAALLMLKTAAESTDSSSAAVRLDMSALAKRNSHLEPQSAQDADTPKAEEESPLSLTRDCVARADREAQTREIPMVHLVPLVVHMPPLVDIVMVHMPPLVNIVLVHLVPLVPGARAL